MADIEKTILEQAGSGDHRGGDEDEAERTRARENSDYATTDDEEKEEDINPAGEFARAAGFHDGPQTGVKGVLADYRHSQRHQRQQRDRQREAEKATYQAAANRAMADSGDRTIWTKDEKDSASDLDELCSDEENERLFAEYRDRRVAELRRVAEKRGLGVLRDATPDEYVDIVEQQADSGAHVAVVLVDQGEASRRFASFVEQEAGNFGQTVFLRVPADECGFSDADVIPIVLVYRYGQLKHNLVRVVDQLADPRNFEQRDVGRLLRNVLLK
ncbi:hypothetical protein LPJ56_006751 [Coemansia sp. RSA 2599]|nr:hypothetical protein LPJ56_006751 [Coemansia sp. RSA 2599]